MLIWDPLCATIKWKTHPVSKIYIFKLAVWSKLTYNLLELSGDNISLDKSHSNSRGMNVGFASGKNSKADDMKMSGQGIGVPTLEMLNPELYKEM